MRLVSNGNIDNGNMPLDVHQCFPAGLLVHRKRHIR